MGNYVSKKINKSDSDNNLENVNYLLNISIEEKEKENEQLKEELENANNDNVRNVEALRKTVILLENELNALKSEKATYVNLNNVLEKKEVNDCPVQCEKDCKTECKDKCPDECNKEDKEVNDCPVQCEKDCKTECKDKCPDECSKDNNIPLIHQPDVLEELEI